MVDNIKAMALMCFSFMITKSKVIELLKDTVLIQMGCIQ